MRFNQFLKNKGFRLFLMFYAVFFVAGAAVLLYIQRGDMVLFINRYSKLEWDPVLHFITDLGLGEYMVVLALLLMFVKMRYTLAGLLSLIFIGIISYVMKEILEVAFTRPLHFFLYDDFTRYIYTAELNYTSSFPSGHTMAIFGMMSLMAFQFQNRIASVCFFTLAIMVGLSRIYLLQHFFVDVYAGAFLGIFSTMLAIWLTENKMGFLNKGFFNRSLQQNLFRGRK